MKIILLDWISCFGENCFFSNKIFHVKHSKRLEVFVYRAVSGEGDSQTRCLCMLSPALRTVWCLLSLQTQSQEWLSHIAVMATKSELFHEEMVSGRWQLNYITYAHMVPHYSVFWARNSRCGSEQGFLEDTPCSWQFPSSSAESWSHNQTCDLECHISVCRIGWRGINTTCGGEDTCQAMQKCHVAFISLHACSLPTPLSFWSSCYSSVLLGEVNFLTWIDNVGSAAHFLANQCKGSKQCLFVLTFFAH